MLQARDNTELNGWDTVLGSATERPTDKIAYILNIWAKCVILLISGMQ